VFYDVKFGISNQKMFNNLMYFKRESH